MAQFPSLNQIVYADWFASGSATGGIQEAVDALAGTVGTVMLSPYKTYSCSVPVSIHTNTIIMFNGAKVIRTGIDDLDPNNSGAVFLTCPFGSNGTPFSSGTPGSNIHLIGPGIIDGGYSGVGVGFDLLTNTSLGMSGLHAKWVTGLFVSQGIKFQNMVQDGMYIDNCMDWQFDQIYMDTVGQWNKIASCNGITWTNNGDSTTAYNRGVLSNFNFRSIGNFEANNAAEALVIVGGRRITITGGVVDGCDFGLEFTGTGTVDNEDIVMSGVDFYNLRSYAITINATSAGLTRCDFGNFKAVGDSTNHDGGLMYLAGSGYNVRDVHLHHFTAENMNAKNTNDTAYIDIQSASGKTRKRIKISQGTIIGPSGSTRTGDTGINIRHSGEDITIDEVQLLDVAGRGISIDDQTAETQTRVRVANTTIEGANSNGVLVRVNTAAATISEVDLEGVITKDCAQINEDSGIKIECANGSGTVKKIRLRGCRSFGSHAYGLSLVRSSGTLDDVTIDDCDLSGTATAPIFQSGTMTNIRYIDPSVKGADIASAASIALGRGDAFSITGTTSIETVTPYVPVDRRIITLYLTTTITLKHNTGSSPKLKLSGDKDFNAVAGDSISLRYDGTDMIEVGRKMAEPHEVINIFDSPSTTWAPTIAGLPLTTSNSQFRMRGDFSRYKQARIVVRGKLGAALLGTISFKVRDLTNSVDITGSATFNSAGTWATKESTWADMNTATVAPGDIDYEVQGSTTDDDLKDIELGAIQLQLRQV